MEGSAPDEATTLVENPPGELAVAVLELDTSGCVRGWSDDAEALLGWGAAEVLGRPAPILPDELTGGLPRLLEEANAGYVDRTAVWQRRDGTPVELAVSASPMRAGSGEPTGVVLVARDISGRNIDQAQLEAYASDVRQSFGRELRRAQELEASYRTTVQALAHAIEAKDMSTGRHLQRVNDLGLLLARELSSEGTVDSQMSFGFLLHDLGKIWVPDAVLNKPGPLTEEEWQLMHRHPEEGARILKDVAFLKHGALDVVLYHHERWDGAGYPAGLAGNEIPLWARIFAVADALDAMTSDRPYRRAMPLETALGELRANSGTQFDPACVDALEAIDREELVRAVGGDPEG